MPLRGWTSACLLPALLAVALTAGPARATTIDEFPIGASPTGIATGPDGNVYVTTSTPSILRIAPDGTVTARYPLSIAAAEPTFVGDRLWFTSGGTTLGHRDADGTIGGGPPVAAQSLTAGPDGNLWFAGPDGYGRVTPGGQATTYPDPIGAPVSIAADGTGQIWLVSNARPSIATVSTTGAFTTNASTAPAWMVATSPASGVAWFADRDAQCCYGQPWQDSVFWLSAGTTGGRVGAGLFGTARTLDLAVGPDGNAWTTDDQAARLGRASASGRVTAFSAGLVPGAKPRFITAGPDATVWFTDDTGFVGRVTIDHPATTTDAATSVSQTAATVTAATSALGTVTRVRFEYGTTTAYGTATRWQDVGDGDAPILHTARLEGLAPGTTYHYRAVLSTAFGTIAGPDRTLTTVPLPPPPPVPPADVDGDGYAAAVDCDDHAPRVFPGAVEIPGDRIDQDCSGADAPLPRFFPHVTAFFVTRHGTWSRFTDLSVDDVPAGATATLTCAGRGCRFKRWTTTPRRDVETLDLLKRLKASKLAAKAQLVLTLTQPGHVGTVVRWRVGPPPKPEVTCLAPGTKKERPC